MDMNRIAKLSVAVTLGLSLMGASLGADAASARSSAAKSQTGGSSYADGPQVIHLGTILVTRADEARVASATTPRSGRTAYLGRIQVSADDSTEARAAAATASRAGTAFLGEVVVTPKDSEAVRYAAAQAAAQPGTAFLVTVEVTAKDTKPAFVGKTVVALRRIGRNAMVSMISALAFVRVGG